MKTDPISESMQGARAQLRTTCDIIPWTRQATSLCAAISFATLCRCKGQTLGPG